MPTNIMIVNPVKSTFFQQLLLITRHRFFNVIFSYQIIKTGSFHQTYLLLSGFLLKTAMKIFVHGSVVTKNKTCNFPIVNLGVFMCLCVTGNGVTTWNKVKTSSSPLFNYSHSIVKSYLRKKIAKMHEHLNHK